MNLSRLFALGLSVSALSLPAGLRAADDPKPATPPVSPGKPETPAKPATPSRLGNMDPVARIRAAVQDLGLTAEQKAKTEEIFKTIQDNFDKAKADAQAGGDPREAFQKAAQSMRGAVEEIVGLMNDDQRQAFQQKMAQRPGGANNPNGQPGQPGRALTISERIKQAMVQINVNEDQKKKIEEIAADLEKKVEELRSAGGDGMREKLMTLRDEAVKSIKLLLTDEQSKKLDELMQQSILGGGRGQGGAGGMLQQLQTAMQGLTLTDEQKTKTATIFVEAQKKMEELRGQFQGGQPGPEAREKFRAVFDTVRDGLQGILTPEQQEKLRSALPQGGGQPRPNPDQPAPGKKEL